MFPNKILSTLHLFSDCFSTEHAITSLQSTPGHEEMVGLLLGQGASINAQTEETQETALTLACCGGFLDVAEFLIKAGADLELGASTPLMEASQEGHLELVR